MSINFQESIVLITSSDPNNRRFGTGFIISKREQVAFVLTCAHVINNIGGLNQVLVDDIPATVIANGDTDGLDMSVLQIPSRKDKPVLNMSASAQTGEPFSTAGFQQYDDNCLLIRRLHGKLGESVCLTYRGSAKRIRAWDLRITDDYQLQPGYSGSPVIGTNERVIGIVSHRQGTGQKGLGISIKALSSIWKKTPTGLIDKEPPSLTRLFSLVTNFEYLDFVQSTGHRGPRHWSHSDPRFTNGQGDSPVTGVSWDDAVEYCDWAGGCLPSTNDESPTENVGTIFEDAPEIGEWHDAGDEQQKQVRNPNTSSLIKIVDHKARLQNVGFRCVPVQPVPLTNWVIIDGGRHELGTDVKKFRQLADIHHLPLALSQAILRRHSKLYNMDSFSISATCVTNEEFYEFTRAAGMPWPCHWDSKWFKRWQRPFPPRLASQPVVNVSAEHAQAYCIRSRTRLPSWLEWERAASGPERQPYPWGTDYNAACCNSIESGRGSLAAVNEYSLGDSPEGVHQLCGNVAEWVVCPDGRFEIRGGSFIMQCELWGLTYAFLQHESGFYAPDIGFRVVVD